MKKLLLGLAAIAVTLSSCQKQETMESIDDGKDVLNFTLYKGVASRASELTNTALQTSATTATNGIALYAYQETSTSGTFEKWFSDNLFFSSNKWQIESTRFRNTVATKFISYYPKSSKLITDAGFATADFNGTLPSFTYTIADVSEQEDLIAGVTTVPALGTDITVGLRHILSQVNFGVRGYEDVTINIKSITVNSVLSKGTYTYKDKDIYPIGTWTPTTDVASYDYSYKTNFSTPVTAKTGDKYIFGDGGNWGPGKDANTWYVDVTNGAVQGNDPDLGTKAKLNNSLMLLPQEGLDDKTVTFTYTIQDIDGAYISGNATTPATGTFNLGEALGLGYDGTWKQNMRYVYIIDFGPFLDDNKLSFIVDVDTQPWENYNKPGDDNGIVDIEVMGEPTQIIINGLTTGDSYYMASKTTTAPSVNQKVQVIRNQTWDWKSYVINPSINSFTIDFTNVIFNSNTITIIVPISDKGTWAVDNAVIDGTTGKTSATFTFTPNP